MEFHIYQYRYGYICSYVDYAWVHNPMHTRRCNYGNVSLGMLVSMSVCAYELTFMCVNLNVYLCRYVGAYHAFICTI